MKSRYDGMDDLLERVRQRLADATVEDLEPATGMSPAGATIRDPLFESLLACVLTVERHTQQLHDLLALAPVELTDVQRAELLALVAKVLREMQMCERTLR